MTVLLAMTVFMLVVMENIPPTSEVVPLLGMTVCTQCNNTNRNCLTLETLRMELLFVYIQQCDCNSMVCALLILALLFCFCICTSLL